MLALQFKIARGFDSMAISGRKSRPRVSSAVRTGNPEAIRSLKDLAREAGVSTGTASRALQDLPIISVAVRERVQALAKAAGYVPDRRAAGLRTGRSRSVGILLADALPQSGITSAAQLRQVINCLTLSLQDRDYGASVVVRRSGGFGEREIQKLSKEMAGFVIIGGDSESVHELNWAPTVALDAVSANVDEDIPAKTIKYLVPLYKFMTGKGCERISLASSGQLYDLKVGEIVDGEIIRVDPHKITMSSDSSCDIICDLSQGDGILATSADDAILAISAIRASGLNENVDVLLAEFVGDATPTRYRSLCGSVVIPDIEKECIFAADSLIRVIESNETASILAKPMIFAYTPEVVAGL